MQNDLINKKCNFNLKENTFDSVDILTYRFVLPLGSLVLR